MAANLIVAYDLDKADSDHYELIRSTIETCATRGFSWLQFSLAYIKTDMSPQGVHDRIRAVMKPTDKLAVIVAADFFVSPIRTSTLVTLQREFQSA